MNCTNEVSRESVKLAVASEKRENKLKTHGHKSVRFLSEILLTIKLAHTKV